MNRKRRTFYAILIIAFLVILVMNILTPYMSDDFYYNPGQGRSLNMILQKVWDNYMTWNGRLVPQFIMTTCLAIPQILFDILNSLVFVILALLMYCNLETNDKFDARSMLIILLSLWFFTVAPGQTLLWTSGACNYLWATVISLGLLTLVRYLLHKKYEATGVKYILVCVGIFTYGIIAGWCNENTSGGVFLLLVFSILQYAYKEIQKDRVKTGISVSCLLCKTIPGYAYAAISGMVLGLLGLVLSPGGKIRMEENMSDESQAGVFALVGRFLKLNEYVKEDFAIVGAIIIVLSCALYYKKQKMEELMYVIALLVSSVATIYVLVMTPTPMDRALFGAGIFLIIAMAQMCMWIDDTEVGKIVKSAAIIMAVIAFSYTFMRDGVNLLRIERELSERDTLVYEQMDQGCDEIELPLLRTEWNNKYTFIYLNDLSEGTEGWGNDIYCAYYDVKRIRGVSREEWNETHQGE